MLKCWSTILFTTVMQISFFHSHWVREHRKLKLKSDRTFIASYEEFISSAMPPIDEREVLKEVRGTWKINNSCSKSSFISFFPTEFELDLKYDEDKINPEFNSCTVSIKEESLVATDFKGTLFSNEDELPLKSLDPFCIMCSNELSPYEKQLIHKCGTVLEEPTMYRALYLLFGMTKLQDQAFAATKSGSFFDILLIS
jgi:hypothetical protein